ncbi:hypothetical protein EKO27_g11577 [Xylaria grammica]|uniref:RNase H type-1 domain-containing protein n=1 Tax=Xylaria grammica TaxID=363999 RepID=A0A439CMY4_9PEZI|nr:hypothetical protein EKO27_g11577 [Xylaria grammica]
MDHSHMPPQSVVWRSPQDCPNLVANDAKTSLRAVFTETPKRVSLELKETYDNEANGVLLAAGLQYQVERAMYRLDDSIMLKNGETIDTASTIIYTQGAARDNQSEASWGVYCGPRSRYNANGWVSYRFPQTKLAADIEANYRALYTACRAIIRSPGCAITFTIATNSWPVLSMMTGEMVELDDTTYATMLGMINECVTLINEMTDGGHKFRYGWVSERTNKRALGYALQLLMDVGSYALHSLSQT